MHGMPDKSSGVLEILRNNDGYLRDPDRSFRPDPKDAFVPRQLIGRFGLTAGARVVGSAALGKRGFKLTDVESVCDLAPAAFGERAPLKDLPAVNPDRRFRLGDGGNPSMRLVELFAPVGRGTRGLIVSPPKAGKTQLLEDIALGIHADSPETRVVALLIDERPEEVTYFRRRVPAEVLASSSDQTLEDHVRLANLTMAQVRCELECGHDVVVLIDSITRMGRAFNAHGAGSGRTMTGGLGDGDRHRTDRYRLAHGRPDLRGVQGHRELRDRAEPVAGRGPGLPRHRPARVGHSPRRPALRRG